MSHGRSVSIAGAAQVLRSVLGDAPGLGITLDPAALKRLTVPRGTTMADGNYSDLIFGPEHYSVAPPYGPWPGDAA